MSMKELTAHQHRLNSLMPGEVRELHVKITEFRRETRFLKVDTLGEALSHIPIWTNDPKSGTDPHPNATPSDSTYA